MGAPGADDWDLRGVVLSEARLTELIQRGSGSGERPRVGRARFDDAEFLGEMDFTGVDFNGVSFARARFTGPVTFSGTDFSGFASFVGTRFDRAAVFTKATFGGPALFAGAHFDSGADFRDASFGDVASFSQTQPEPAVAEFSGKADFGGARFASDLAMGQVEAPALSLARAAVEGNVELDEAVFMGVLDLNEARVGGSIAMDRAAVEEISAERLDVVGGLAARKLICREDLVLRAAEIRVLDLVGATIGGHASFELLDSARAELDRVDFGRGASFKQARASDELHLGGARFRGDSDFSEGSFGSAHFGPARLAVRTVDGVRFEGEARFVDARFVNASFDRARFAADARFDATEFAESASFIGAAFAGDGLFANTIFKGVCDLSGVTTTGTLALDAATFDCNRLVLDRASFPHRVSIEGRAEVLTCRDTRFGAGARLSIDGAVVALDGADFSGASTITGSGSRLCSVAGANVGDLTVGSLDLRSCRFGGAIGLDKLRLQGLDALEPNPRSVRNAARRTIAEEHQWRASTGTPGWYPEGCRPPEAIALESYEKAPDPPTLASIYRALRKGREDEKDEPGAADLYYGEMSMRRSALKKAPPDERSGEWLRRNSERALLTMYWLVSGYGLRASRAFAALLVVVAAAGFGLWQVGFNHRPGLHRAELFSLTSVSSLFRAPRIPPPAKHLTYGGEWMTVGLRIAGPVLLGLLILSLRGRVKR